MKLMFIDHPGVGALRPLRLVGLVQSVVIALLGLLLSACGEPAPAPTSNAPPAGATSEAGAAPSAESSAPSAAAQLSVEQLLSRAQRALAAGRRFHPPGDNAVDYYLRIIELAEKAPAQSAESGSKRRLFDALSDQSPADSARTAIRDLVPLGLMRVEGALSESNWDEADQVLQTLRATGQASEAIARLQQRLATAREAERQARIAAQQPAPRRPTAPIVDRSRDAGVAAVASATVTPPASVAGDSGAVVATAADVAAPTSGGAPITAAPPVVLPARAPTEVASAPATAAARVEPRLISQAAPRYPNEARRKRIEGFVELRFTVREDGSVAEVEVLSAEPSGWFEREAVQAAKRWRFEPLAEAQQLQRVLNFRLD